MSGVMLAWLDGGTVRGEFTESLAALLLADGGVTTFTTERGGPRIAEARNRAVNTFAASDCEWLWFVDADMVFPPDTLRRLLEVADRETAPVVGALCRQEGGEPTLFRATEDNEVERVAEWEDGAVIPVDATGTGCILIHRQVLAAMQKAYGTLPSGVDNPYTWFVDGLVTAKGAPVGSDTSFCLRARQLGVPIVVHTGVKVGHVKARVVGEVA